jgi:hypothetical protein
MVGSFPWSELAVADQASPNTTSHNKDFANHLDLLLFINHD